MNNIKNFKNIGKGKRIFLLGNGPSLNDMDLSVLNNEITFAMNRIDLIYSKTSWRPTYYVFCSDNCRNSSWGKEWSRSVFNCSNNPTTTAFIWERYKKDIEKNSEALPLDVVYLNSLSENPIGNPKTFSKDAEKRLDKAGTTMNVALQLAYYMGFDTTYLIGCDSNWKTATNTKRSGDPNHFSSKYYANIRNSKEEFRRMNETHKIARKAFDDAGKKIYNAGLNSAITAYDKVNFNSII